VIEELIGWIRIRDNDLWYPAAITLGSRRAATVRISRAKRPLDAPWPPVFLEGQDCLIEIKGAPGARQGRVVKVGEEQSGTFPIELGDLEESIADDPD